MTLALVVGEWTYAFSHLRIGGPVYQMLSDNSVISNDAEPPALFVVEAYLAVLEAARATHPEKFAKAKQDEAGHRKAFEKRYAFWETASLADAQKRLLTGPVYEEAEKFFSLAEKEFFPALERGDRDGAETAFTMLSDAFDRHHVAVLELIRLIDADHAAIESDAASMAARVQWLVGAVVAFAVALVAVVGWSVRRSILRPLAALENSVVRLGAGDTASPVAEQDRADELGPLARALEGWRGSLIADAQNRRADKEHSARALHVNPETERRIAEFRQSVNGVLQSVAQAVVRTEGTATTLKSNAESGRHLAGVVNSASQRAASSEFRRSRRRPSNCRPRFARSALRCVRRRKHPRPQCVRLTAYATSFITWGPLAARSKA
ncbi:HAMP domain-containing protein [Rhodoblastus acidophilus]|uniref:HAMP domain-containing protein n=1 Tax=Rhodoblastus acidophilus TaxID=1074 RepID=A0A6N8DMI1_RHOAC|nr:HAMP domain-containing protein [Rhodoblastus acidophilus]MCW2275316.1 methyl-accepting chemotaxis protein [Rhodoblastus acidophilus]MTV31792.1 HAMP domain-containing protein [Rhodoblastus acidophilus]